MMNLRSLYFVIDTQVKLEKEDFIELEMDHLGKKTSLLVKEVFLTDDCKYRVEFKLAENNTLDKLFPLQTKFNLYLNNSVNSKPQLSEDIFDGAITLAYSTDEIYLPLMVSCCAVAKPLPYLKEDDNLLDKTFFQFAIPKRRRT